MEEIKRQKVTAILNSPLGYKYKLACIYKYKEDNTNKKVESSTFYIGRTLDEVCITIAVTHIKRMFSDPTIASLILVKYYETCSENKGLKRGEGTVDMMNTAMSFVKQVCPFIRAFKLNDSSAKTCDNGATISLPTFYITQKGKTWYEEQFGAHLLEPLHTLYRTCIYEVMNMQIDSIDSFMEEYIYGSSTSNISLDMIRSLYKPNMTVGDFFKALYETHTKSVACELLQPWIDIFMEKMGLLHYINNRWYIPADRIAPYPFPNTNKSLSIRRTRKRDPWNNSNLQ